MVTPLTLLSWLILSMAGPGPAIDGEALARRVDAIVGAHIQESGVPGVVVTVVQGERIVLERGWGVADIDSGRPMDPRTTLVRIASLSKTFTATAVAQLEDAGRLDIDADVDRYLTGIKTAGDFEQPVTVRQLLAHTSGFINFNAGRVSLEPLHRGDFEAFVARTMPPRMFPPGTATIYSNHGNALAGVVVQDISGVPFADYVHAQILVPLGMLQTSYYLDKHQPELASSYTLSGGRIALQPYEYFGTVPASAVHTTAHDMAAYLMLHAGDGSVRGTTVLSPEAMGRMRTPHATIHPALPEHHYAFAPTVVQGRPGRAHGGSVPAFLSRMVVFDEERVGVFVAQNAFGPNVAGDVIKAVADALPQSTAPSDTPLGDGRPTAPEQLIGEYRVLDKYETAAFTRPRAVLSQSALSVAVDDEGFLTVAARRYLQTGERTFQAVRDDGHVDTLVFTRDADGAVAWVHLNQSSAMRPAWHGRRVVQIGAYAVAFLSLFAGLAGARRRELPLHRVWAALAAAALVGTLTPQIYAFVVDLGQPVYTQPLRLGIPSWIPVLLWAPRLAALAALAMLFHRRHRPAYAIAGGSALLYLLELYWRTPSPGLPAA